MKKPPKKLRKKIKHFEEEIAEEKGLWSKIRNMPQQDKKWLGLLKSKKSSKKKKAKVTKSLQEKINKFFWGLEPPEKTKK